MRFSLAKILVLADSAIPPPVPFCTRASAGLKRVGGAQFARESTAAGGVPAGFRRVGHKQLRHRADVRPVATQARPLRAECPQPEPDGSLLRATFSGLVPLALRPRVCQARLDYCSRSSRRGRFSGEHQRRQRPAAPAPHAAQPARAHWLQSHVEAAAAACQRGTERAAWCGMQWGPHTTVTVVFNNIIIKHTRLLSTRSALALAAVARLSSPRPPST